MEQDMTQGKPLSIILKFTLPLLVGNIFQQFYNILHRLYIAFPQEVPFMKKNPAKQDSPPAAGRASDILPFRRSAILAERFYRMETKFPIR